MSGQEKSPLALLLELEAHTRELESLAELHYFLVNEPAGLAPYRQAALFDLDGKVLSLSGVAKAEKNVPFVQWLESCMAHQSFEDGNPKVMTGADWGSDSGEWLPSQIILIPLTTGAGERVATLLLARDKNWTKPEVTVLHHLAGAAAYAWRKLDPQKRTNKRKPVPVALKIGGLLAILALFFIPVRLSVLAEAEIVAKTPLVVRAPMQGVVEKVLVTPNQTVKTGALLLQMDTRELESNRLITQKKLDSLRSQYRQLTRQALIEPKEKVRLAIVASEVKEMQAELHRLETLIERATVRAAQGGVVILDSAQDWMGKPVQIGEKVLSVAAADDLQIEAWLPVGDAIALPKEAELRLFLNASPLAPIDAKIKRVSYKAEELPQGILAHRVVAEVTSATEEMRLGAQGTARLEGERVSVFYWVFRRPIATIRQFLGV